MTMARGFLTSCPPGSSVGREEPNDADVGTGQGVRDIDAAEPATYDDYPVPLTRHAQPPRACATLTYDHPRRFRGGTRPDNTRRLL